MLGFCAYFFFWKSRNRIAEKNAKDSFLCSSLLLVFWLLMCFSTGWSKGKLFLAVGLFSILGFVFWLVVLAGQGNFHIPSLEALRSSLISNIPIYILIALVIVLSLEEFGMGVKWDSSSYYRTIIGLSTFTLSPAEVVSFQAANHLCYGYIFLSGFGYYALSDHLFGVRIVTVVLYLLATVSIWSILYRCLGKKRSAAFVATSAFAFTPTVLGPLHEINPEMCLLAMFLCFIWTLLTNRKVLQLFVLTLFLFTKETALVYLLLLLIGFMTMRGFRDRKNGSTSVRSFLALIKGNFMQVIVLYLPCIIFLFHRFCQGTGWGNGNASSSAAASAGKVLNTVCISKANIMMALKQTFIMNYAWIPTCLIVAYMVYSIIDARHHGKPAFARMVSELEHNQILLPLVFVFMGFLTVQLFYVTYRFPRYSTFGVPLMCIIIGILINDIEMRRWLSYFILSSFCLLELSEVFYTSDPVTLCLFDTIDAGDATITSSSSIIAYAQNGYRIQTDSSAKAMILSPYSYNNRQWGYFDYLIDRAFQAMNYTQSDLVILPDAFNPISAGPLLGYCTDNYFDSVSGHLYQKYGEDRDYSSMAYVNYRIAGVKTGLPTTSGYSHVYYIGFSFSEAVDDALLADVPVNTVKTVSFKGWDATVYELATNNE